LKPRWNWCVTLTLAALAATPASAQRLQWAPNQGLAWNRPYSPPNTQYPTPTEVVVRFRGDVSGVRREQLVGTFGCQIARADPSSGYALVRVRDNRGADLLGVLARRPEVLHAEPSYWLHALATSYYDPYEWYLFDRGTTSARAPSNFGIQCPSAWAHTKGAGVTVALVDTGAAYENYSGFHQAPALSHTQFAAGFNIIDNTDHPNDDNQHGTLVTGVIASNLVSGGGVVGVAPEVTVMPVKVLGTDGGGSDFEISEGIRWAADHGANVINLSLGGAQAGQVLADAVNYAASKDCVLVAACGNDNASQVEYPAGFSNCIAAGSTGFDGTRAPYSNRDKNKSMLVAPGGNLSEDLNGDGAGDGIIAQTFDPQRGFDSFGYTFWEGTSFSSPMVAGVAALVRAANPGLSATDVRTTLRSTAFHLGSTGRNVYYGYGLVDAAAAVESALAQKSASG
jgi:serine protease